MQSSADGRRFPRPAPALSSAPVLTRAPWRRTMALGQRAIVMLTLAFAPGTRAVQGPRWGSAGPAACRPPGSRRRELRERPLSVLCASIDVVMTMRSNFLGNAAALHGLAEAINSGIYLTPRQAAEQVRSVITSPLSLVGGAIDPLPGSRLVNTLSGQGELPVLEHARLRKWDRARSQGRSSIEAGDSAGVCAPRDQSGYSCWPSRSTSMAQKATTC